jgi:hypothetical protein
VFGGAVVTKKMAPAGTTDGTIQRLEAKVKLLERRCKELQKDAELARCAGDMDGMRRALRQWR